MLRLTPLCLLLKLVTSQGQNEQCDNEMKAQVMAITARMIKMEAKYEQSKEAMTAELKIKEAEMEAIYDQREANLREELANSIPHAVEQAMRDLPYVMLCVFQETWDTSAGTTITYDTFLSNYNNHERPGGGDGLMNLETGIFTCMTAGHYTVSISGFSELNEGELIDMWLFQNDQRVAESDWYQRAPTFTEGFSSGYKREMGSRTVVRT